MVGLPADLLSDYSAPLGPLAFALLVPRDFAPASLKTRPFAQNHHRDNPLRPLSNLRASGDLLGRDLRITPLQNGPQGVLPARGLDEHVSSRDATLLQYVLHRKLEQRDGATNCPTHAFRSVLPQKKQGLSTTTSALFQVRVVMVKGGDPIRMVCQTKCLR